MRDPSLPTFRIWHLFLLMLIAAPCFKLLSYAPWEAALVGILLINGLFWWGVAKVIHLEDWGLLGLPAALVLGAMYLVTGFGLAMLVL